MTILSEATVRLNVPSASKEEAIKMAGDLLVQAGHVSPPYVEGMLAREKTMTTYMGNGVAIPHGQLDDKENIHSTGISVVQFRQGVNWNPDEVAHLVIGIAATADEHLGILLNLAEVLEEPEEAQQLAQTDNPEEIITRLNRAPSDLDD